MFPVVEPNVMLQRIILHLARNRNFPDGSPGRGYEIVAPLDTSGHLDADVWQRRKSECRVRRFWTGEGDRTGQLAHHAGGVGGATWRIHYPDAIGDDETGYRLGAHRFVENEYMSIHDGNGHSNTFRIARVGLA
jgi:hypothetical protein